MNNKLDFGLIAGQIGQPGIDSFITCQNGSIYFDTNPFTLNTNPQKVCCGCGHVKFCHPILSHGRCALCVFIKVVNFVLFRPEWLKYFVPELHWVLETPLKRTC